MLFDLGLGGTEDRGEEEEASTTVCARDQFGNFELK
jgi:hypothetical protein